MAWITKARKDLRAIESNYSLQSYLQANRKKDGTFYKKHRPYSISEEGLKALELLQITYNEPIAKDQEEEIKAFLMPYRLIKTEYLINTDNRLNY